MLLQLEHVAKQYEACEGSEPVPVLKDVSISLDVGESMGVMGPSGCGKSTLLNIIGALDRPSSGRVILAGKDLSALSDKRLAEVRNLEIGFVFQLHHLLPQCTVFENVLVPTIPGHRGSGMVVDRARKLLDRVGLGSRLSHRPGRLSGGERQRVAVVRALINKPSLLLADEPTGSLDQASADNLGQLLVDLNREEKVALIVVTHSTQLAGRMGRRFRLANGTLAEEAGR